jgi:hypothetical protein
MFGKSLGFGFSQTGMRLLIFLSEMQEVTTQTFPKPLWSFMSSPNIPQSHFDTQTFPNKFLHAVKHNCTNRLYLQCVSRISMRGQVQQNKIMSNDMKAGFIAWGARGREFKSHRPDHLINIENIGENEDSNNPNNADAKNAPRDSPNIWGAFGCF